MHKEDKFIFYTYSLHIQYSHAKSKPPFRICFDIWLWQFSHKSYLCITKKIDYIFSNWKWISYNFTFIEKMTRWIFPIHTTGKGSQIIKCRKLSCYEKLIITLPTYLLKYIKVRSCAPFNQYIFPSITYIRERERGNWNTG